MVYSVDDRILIEKFYKFKNCGAKNLLENFLEKLTNKALSLKAAHRES